MDLGTSLTGVLGGKTSAELEKHFAIRTVGDLLSHYPRRYVERGALVGLEDVEVGDHVTVVGDIVSFRDVPFSSGPRRGTRQEVTISDGRRTLLLTFFNQAWRLKSARVGQRGLFAGKVTEFRGKLQLTHPDFQLFDEDSEGGAAEFAAAVIPVYPATAKLPTWQVARCVRLVLGQVDDLPDHLPASIRKSQGYVDLLSAYRLIHEPGSLSDAHRGRARLRFDEAFLLQVHLAQLRHATAGMLATPRAPTAAGLRTRFDSSLPFALTSGQRAIGEQIDADLASDHPMHRLLQGDVGSGKTVVALRAMLAAVDAGGQAALLAPTEVLAAQHHRSISGMLGPMAESGLFAGDGPRTSVALVTGSMSAATRRKVLMDVFTGDAGIVVGTHALLEDSVSFGDLGLVVIDEQHRFGVEQRAALAAKAPDGSRPHVLVMTATPIPRTVAMTVFGDLEVSTLDELPAGRQPKATHLVPAEKPAFADRAWQRIREEVADGRQAYVVCPRIGDEEPTDGLNTGRSASGAAGRGSQASGAEDDGAVLLFDDQDGKSMPPMAAVLETVAQLQEGPLEGLRVRALHGRMPAEEKDRIMNEFAGAEIDVLVSTTVIEVGVDVPNATVMAILDADRFGISSLHQLRGRIGRGGHAGLCLLFTSAPPGSPSRERLEMVAGTEDGFELSKYDLETRREGNILGASQSGRFSKLRLLSALRDGDVIARARESASELVRADPALHEHPQLLEALAALLDDDAEYLEKS